MTNRKYKSTTWGRVLVLFIFFIMCFGIREAYISREIDAFIFFLLIAIPGALVIVITAWAGGIEIEQNWVINRIIGKIQSKFIWDEIVKIRDINLLFWHIYWVIASEKIRIPWWNWGTNLLIGNDIKNYSSLLANIITHSRPNTPVSSSILRHLNMTKDDIGKYYKQDIWIDKVKVNSYWKEKIF